MKAGKLLARGVSAEDSGHSAGVSESDSPSAVAPDSTGRNGRDRWDTALTPGDPGYSEADLKATRRIREAITENNKNIKIVTVNGKVTVLGPVKDARELSLVESVKREPGARNLTTNLK